MMTYVRQAANVLQVLEFFAERTRPANAAEVAEALGWPRSSSFKLLTTLADRGYLYEPVPRGGYYPTPRWLELAEKISAADPLPPALSRLATALRDETSETSAISAVAGAHAIFVDVAESRLPVRYFARIGDRVPIHASSAGRALLAQMSLRERQDLYRRADFTAHSATTPTTPDAVEAALDEAAARGWHQSNAEYTSDLAGVAMPLPVPGRRLSVVVVGPVSRCLDRRAELAATMARHVAALAG